MKYTALLLGLAAQLISASPVANEQALEKRGAETPSCALLVFESAAPCTVTETTFTYTSFTKCGGCSLWTAYAPQPSCASTVTNRGFTIATKTVCEEATQTGTISVSNGSGPGPTGTGGGLGAVSGGITFFPATGGAAQPTAVGGSPGAFSVSVRLD